MPSASDELRARIKEWFGYEIDEIGPANFLRENGWTEEKFMWTEPPDRETTTKEWDCLQYLIDEWDEGYLPRREA